MKEGDKVLVHHISDPETKWEGVVTRVWTEDIARVTVSRTRDDGSRYFVDLDNVGFGSESEGLFYAGEVVQPDDNASSEGDK
jgi:hypothetical protein